MYAYIYVCTVHVIYETMNKT